MNKKQRYLIERKNKELIRISNLKLNCLRWSSVEKKEHILKKLEIGMWLKKNKFNFITEAIVSKTGVKMDVFDITRGICFEVLNSEREEACLEKTLNYPDVEIRMIRADKELKTEDLE